MSRSQPLRVLHVLGGLGVGGVETWLMGVLRTVDRSRIAMDVLVHTDEPKPYDDEARSLGVAIHPVGSPRDAARYVRRLRRVLGEHGPYDVVHSHVAYFSGPVLAVAATSRVPVRIAHSHTDRRRTEAAAGRARHAYIAAARALVRRSATRFLAVTRPAGLGLLGERWDADLRASVLPYGIELDRFRALSHDDGDRRAAFRASLGVPTAARVVGHIGRFSDVKNHAFLVDVFAATRSADPSSHLLLVGDGPLRPEIERRVEGLGLGDAVTFAGLRFDVPQVLRDAVDVFVLPSKHEGQPLVLIEAQATGTPCVVSDAVPPEVAVLPGVIATRSLTDPVSEWVDEIRRAGARRMPAAEALALAEASPLAVAHCVAALEAVYRGG